MMRSFFLALMLACSLSLGAKELKDLGVVIDAKQNLNWYSCRSDGMNMESTIWKFAASYCENLYFMGSTMWRLPTPKELQTMIAQGLIKDMPQDVYWTSSPDPEAPEDNALVVYSTNGHLSSQDICEFARIICVE